MKNLFQIFDENFEVIKRLVDQDNLSGCSSIATDLITISVMSKFGDGVLIGEIFEGVFDQIGPLFNRFEISEDEGNAAKEKIKEQVKLVAEAYKHEDKKELYEALKNLRTVATELQFKCANIMKRKTEGEESRHLRQRMH